MFDFFFNTMSLQDEANSNFTFPFFNTGKLHFQDDRVKHETMERPEILIS